jgi:hypothetical protein
MDKRCLSNGKIEWTSQAENWNFFDFFYNVPHPLKIPFTNELCLRFMLHSHNRFIDENKNSKPPKKPTLKDLHKKPHYSRVGPGRASKGSTRI